MDERYGFILPIWERWWNEFCRLSREGKSLHAHIRGGFAPPKECRILFFYVVKPVGRICGYAEFAGWEAGYRDEMWRNHGHESCLGSKNLYDEFFKGRQKVSFIRFKNLHEASNPVKFDNILPFLREDGKMPRKGFYVDKENTYKLIKILR